MTDPLLLCAWCGDQVSEFYAYNSTCPACRKERLEERAGGSRMENTND